MDKMNDSVPFCTSLDLSDKSSSFEGQPDAATDSETRGHTLLDSSTAQMPPPRPRANPPRRDVDLSEFLSPQDKDELVSLIHTLTESMLKRILRSFDPSSKDDPSLPSRVAFWGKLPSYLRDNNLSSSVNEMQTRSSLLENLKPSRSKKAGRAAKKLGQAPPKADKKADNAAVKEEMQAPRLPELKKEVIQHFRKWQNSVHKRIGDISVRRPPVATFPRGRNRRGRRGDCKCFRPGLKMSCSLTTIASRTAAQFSALALRNGGPGLALEADPLLEQLYPPTPTTLASWPVEKRCLLLHVMILLLISLEHYSAYTRTLLLNLTSSLRLPLRVFVNDEVRVGGAMAHVARIIPPEALLARKQEGKPSRKWKEALASMPGIAIAGPRGLAIPLAAAGFGSILGITGINVATTASLLASMTENGLKVGSFFGVPGARLSSGKMMEHYLKDVADFAFLPLRGSIGENIELGKVANDSRRLRVVLGIYGWMTNKSDLGSHWRCLGSELEAYTVRWEVDTLSKLGESFELMLKSATLAAAKKEIKARVSSEPRSMHPKTNGVNANQNGPVLTHLTDRRWPAGLLKLSKVIDHNWHTGMVRADKLGIALADVLISKAQGERGVSLIGYSLGARAIYTCLMSLCERRAFGLVENAILMGTPAPSDPLAWCAMKSVVSGRLVNVYSENDYILGFLSRMCNIQFGLAGIQRITGVDGIENVDVSAKVSVHTRYRFLAGSILRHIGWGDLNEGEIDLAEAAMAAYEEEQRKHEERREMIENGAVLTSKENEQGIIRTRMRKKGRK